MMLPERRPYIRNKGMFRLVLGQQAPVFPQGGAADGSMWRFTAADPALLKSQHS